MVFEDPAVTLRGTIVARVEETGSVFTAAPSADTYLAECSNWLHEISEMVQAYAGLEDGALDQIWRVPMADFGLAARSDVEGAGRYRHRFEVLTGKAAPPPELDNDDARRGSVSSESWDYRRTWKVYERRGTLLLSLQGLRPAQGSFRHRPVQRTGPGLPVRRNGRGGCD